MTQVDSQTQPLAQTPITPKLLEMIHGRISILLKLNELETARGKLTGGEHVDEQAARECQRQQREAQRIPPAETIRNAVAGRKKKLAALAEKIAAGDAPPLSEAMIEALTLADQQWQILLKREAMVEPLLANAAGAAIDEPLRAVLAESGIACEALFGWAVYANALIETRQRFTSQADSEEPDKAARAKALLQVIPRELNSIEREMVEQFWQVYAEASALLAGGSLNAEQARCIRAFLRCGLLIRAPWFVAPDRLEAMLASCDDVRTELDPPPAGTHVLYADEYLDLVARGKITPAPDEDLELNGTGTDQWKRDKMWRKLIGYTMHAAGMTNAIEGIEAKVSEIEATNAELQGKLDHCELKGSDLRRFLVDTKDEIQANKVAIARHKQAIEHIRDTIVADDEERVRDARAKLQECGGDYDPAELARKEAGQLRKIARLVNKLKEPFLPIAMRDDYRPETGAVNDRQAVTEAVADAEQRDVNVFGEVAVYAKTQAKRTYVRFSPVFVLAPCGGIMNFSWSPRSGGECGRIVAPLISARPGQFQSMLWDSLSDFQWDTSKEQAGVDLLTSDTLVARYCQVRWDYRNRSKEAREKAAIYMEEKERANFRRHYALFVSSIEDGGKRLFFKCPEVYEAVVKYLGLPPGVEKLSK